MDVYLRLNDKRRSHILSIPYRGNLYYPSIIHCGTQEYLNDKKRGMKAHDHKVYHVLLFLEGDTEFISAGKSLSAARGLFVISSPGDLHSFIPHLPGRLKYIEITFEYISHEQRMDKTFEEVLSLLFNIDVENKGFYLLDEEKIELFQNLHRSLYYCLISDNYLKADYQVDLLLQKIFLFVLEIMGYESNLSKKNRESLNKRAYQLREMIHSRFPAKLNLNEISLELGISKSYLIKKFREEFGRTPLDYDRTLRINAAADLIISTNRTLEDIALSLGFCDVFYFIKTFKQYKGVTPGKYH